jgi:uncharacterized lipoprotein YbaY
MSYADWTAELERSFHRTEQLLEQLLLGLKARRAAWISARARVLAPSTELEAVTQQIAREEDARGELLARIRRALPPPLGGDHEDLHLNVSRIAASMPADGGERLLAAARAAQRLAKDVRFEVTLGERLLRFSRRAQLGAATRPEATAAGYDRRARCLHGTAAGGIVDGKI